MPHAGQTLGSPQMPQLKHLVGCATPTCVRTPPIGVDCELRCCVCAATPHPPPPPTWAAHVTARHCITPAPRAMPLLGVALPAHGTRGAVKAGTVGAATHVRAPRSVALAYGGAGTACTAGCVGDGPATRSPRPCCLWCAPAPTSNGFSRKPLALTAYSANGGDADDICTDGCVAAPQGRLPGMVAAELARSRGATAWRIANDNAANKGWRTPSVLPTGQTACMSCVVSDATATPSPTL